jgi:hypothetical protein
MIAPFEGHFHGIRSVRSMPLPPSGRVAGPTTMHGATKAFFAGSTSFGSRKAEADRADRQESWVNDVSAVKPKLVLSLLLK